MTICTARKHVTCSSVGKEGTATKEICQVERMVACRGTCKFDARLWAMGPTCVLKVLQAFKTRGIQNDGGKPSIKKIKSMMNIARHATATSNCNFRRNDIMHIHRMCALNGRRLSIGGKPACSRESCVNLARTF